MRGRRRGPTGAAAPVRQAAPVLRGP